MKRQTAMALAAVFAMSVAGTALAAPANPFVDVPAKHWSYDAVTKLAQAGVISGYGDGTFRGDTHITRYEMATLVAKAMANCDNADPEIQKTVDALAAEYATELNNLGVRVDNLEKKVGNVKLSGDVRLRYENIEYKEAGFKDSTDTFKARARIAATAAINDEWTANVRFEGVENLRTSGQDDDTYFDVLSVSGPLFGTKATFGRFEVVPVYGTVIDSTVDGAMFAFGNKLKTTLIYGKGDTTANETLGAVAFGYAPSKNMNLSAVYYNVEDLNSDNGSLNIWELGFDTKVAKNLVLKASYAKSNEDLEILGEKQDTAYQAGLWYKGAKKQDKGSFGAWAQYLNIEDFAVLDTTWASGAGYKGVEVGLEYAPQKNMVFKTLYFDGEDTIDGKQDKNHYRAQVEFFF